MHELQEIVDRCKRIAFCGGAGVSTASGLPDFRGKDGLYAKRFGALTPEMMLSASFFYIRTHSPTPRTDSSPSLNTRAGFPR